MNFEAAKREHSEFIFLNDYLVYNTWKFRFGVPKVRSVSELLFAPEYSPPLPPRILAANSFEKRRWQTWDNFLALNCFNNIYLVPAVKLSRVKTQYFYWPGYYPRFVILSRESSCCNRKKLNSSIGSLNPRVKNTPHVRNMDAFKSC